MKTFNFLLTMKTALAALSMDYVQQVTEKEFGNETESLRGNICDPMFGVIATSLGVFENIRFYSPALELYFDKKNENKRVSEYDTSLDPFTSAVIKMWPSANETFSVSTNAPSNPATLFNNNPKNIATFFGKLFCAIFNGKKKKDFLDSLKAVKVTFIQTKKKILFIKLQVFF